MIFLNILFAASHEYAIFYPNWKGAIEKLKANNTRELTSFNASQIINKWIQELRYIPKEVLTSNEISEKDMQNKDLQTDDGVDVDAMRLIEEEITNMGRGIENAIEAFEEGKDLFNRSKELVKTKVVDPVRVWFKQYF